MNETAEAPDGERLVTVVTVRDRRTLRGSGVIEFDGTDREAVLAEALKSYAVLRADWRDPTHPCTFARPGGWKATISYWSVE